MVNNNNVGDVPVHTIHAKSWTLTISELSAGALRLVFSKFAENSAYATLVNTCTMSGYSIAEPELRHIIKNTIVPAYTHGWLYDVVTLQQLQKWVDKRAVYAFSDPLVELIGLGAYFELHCHSSAVDAGKMEKTLFLQACPISAYVNASLFSDADLEQWRPGASVVRQAILELSPKEGSTTWLNWVNHGQIETQHLPPLFHDEH